MDKEIDIPEELYSDEAVCFIAPRYHTNPQNAILCFLVQSGAVSVSDGAAAASPIHLEENEMEILRGLIYGRKNIK